MKRGDLRKIFDAEELSAEKEALDLLTSYYGTMQFLEAFQRVIFDRTAREMSVKQFYLSFLQELGLINTIDDIPAEFTGSNYNPNEKQASRNLKYPMGLGAIAANLWVNLGLGKDVAARRLPRKFDLETKQAWGIDNIDIRYKDYDTLDVMKVATRLRNAVSHNNFKIRIPIENIGIQDVREKVQIMFYDAKNNKGEDEFLAIASYGVIETFMRKIHSAEYEFHHYPHFEFEELNSATLFSYVDACFKHFCRSVRGVSYENMVRLSPLDEYECLVNDDIERPRSDVVMVKVEFSVNGVSCDDQVFWMPYLNSSRPGLFESEGISYVLGENPLAWLLYHESSPIYNLSKLILSMADCARLGAKSLDTR
ncbi:hypothetical protein [Pseudomonas simiae]|uniref:hypothetical protein n=1 Tax=Pseudomonas simiae TaxID=321846 RepID=UPI0005C3DCA1|nr:hypothetical protein [Pseudomonas simiae]AJP52222.1 hypothetical protein PF1751_v1c25220 [Pseudomonas simiae]